MLVRLKALVSSEECSELRATCFRKPGELDTMESADGEVVLAPYDACFGLEGFARLVEAKPQANATARLEKVIVDDARPPSVMSLRTP